MGDSALVFYLPLYLTTELGMGSVGSGVHLTLLTFLAIFFGANVGVAVRPMGAASRSW